MSAPLQVEIINPIEYYKSFKDGKYFILLEILGRYFLVLIEDDDYNLNSLFAWIYNEESKRDKKFLNKSLKCVFKNFYNSKYKSLISNKGLKIDNILRNVDEYLRHGEIEIKLNKDEIKNSIKDVMNKKLNIFKDYINEDININSLSKINSKVKICNIFLNYNFMEFLITFDVPYVIKKEAFIFLFEKKEIDKFLFDIKFLYNNFQNESIYNSLYLLSLLKKYAQSSQSQF